MATTVVVLNQGYAVLTNRIIQAGTAPKYIGWGTGTLTTALATDTGLGPTTVEKLVDLSTSAGTDHTTGTEARATTTQTNDTYQVTGTRTATGAGTVTCSGLFDAASGGTCTIKASFDGVALASGDSIAYTWSLKLA